LRVVEVKKHVEGKKRRPFWLWLWLWFWFLEDPRIQEASHPHPNLVACGESIPDPHRCFETPIFSVSTLGFLASY
jgi:hypothetical protein